MCASAPEHQQQQYPPTIQFFIPQGVSNSLGVNPSMYICKLHIMFITYFILYSEVICYKHSTISPTTLELPSCTSPVSCCNTAQYFLKMTNTYESINLVLHLIHFPQTMPISDFLFKSQYYKQQSIHHWCVRRLVNTTEAPCLSSHVINPFFTC